MYKEGNHMTGIIINVLAVAIGGILGALLGDKLSEDFVKALNSVFGICALGMGIYSLMLMENMPAVILAVILGTVIGLVIHLGDKISGFGAFLQKLITKEEDKLIDENEAVNLIQKDGYTKHLDVSLFVTAMVLFCSSGTGIYGSIDAGMTGNITILLSKSVLDLFTAMIFACSLGPITSIIAVPQLIIFVVLYLLAGTIFPLTTPEMIGDFKACGGFILLATGLRIAKIKEFPIADMIPAMIIVMPISYIWTAYIIPLL